MILHSCRGAVLSAAILGLGPMATQAQDNPGQVEYMNNCSACHGESALGDGPVAKYMNVTVPGLTTLAQRNDGEFPYLTVIQVIDGRQGLGPHGTPMPVWGTRFKATIGDDAGPYGAELLVRGRLQALADYLASIQE